MPEPTVGQSVANIKTWKDGYVDEYPEFGVIADQQMEIFWPWSEIKVSKDKQDLLVGVTESEKHGIISSLKLFTKYELFVGNEQWGGRVSKAYPHVSPQRMSAVFAHVELNSHAPFYNEINKELGLANYAFYTSYLEDPILASRMEHINSVVDDKDDELSTSMFSIVEGGVLYSVFAYLKHYQSQGKNKAQNIARGINMSARDENLHSIGGAGLVKVALAEQQRSSYEMKAYHQAIKEGVSKLFEHECAIIKKTLEFGPVDGWDELEAIEFVKSRLNICLGNLNLPAMYTVTHNPIAEWFYKGINNYQMNDFFQGVGREYKRDWDRSRFIWKKG